MALYLFSDAHLGSNGPASEALKIEKLITLFELIKQDGDRVIILGDLFDFWFEYKHAIPKEHHQVLFVLSDLVRRDIKVDYISGNHDFWIDNYFSQQLGISVHQDDFDFEYQDYKLHCTHGDGLAKADRGYRFLKRVLRNRFNIWAYRKLPVDWAIPLAKFVAGSSRKHTSKRVYDFDEDYEQYARTKLESGYDIVAIGHLHRATMKHFDQGTYINTGDFIDAFSYARIDSDSIQLLYL
ncbi:MAG: UDP-2,3-diacylglucosamine diphosphatase [bacterium]|nr:UDP-2,3-diacylglucosamine diphosphatase [bacterium]